MILVDQLLINQRYFKQQLGTDQVISHLPVVTFEATKYPTCSSRHDNEAE